MLESRQEIVRNRGGVPEASRVGVGGGEKKKLLHLTFTSPNSERREPNGPDHIHNSQQQQLRQSAVEVVEGRGNQQRQSAVEGRRQWHQQVCVVVSPPAKIRLALPAEFFKRGAATGVGGGSWGCRGGEEPASRA